MKVENLEDKISKTKEMIARKFELPQDVVLGIPKITIVGENEITIENHRGIIRFEENEIKVNSNAGLISIYGSNFEILFIGGSTITINGKFKSMVYESNE